MRLFDIKKVVSLTNCYHRKRCDETTEQKCNVTYPLLVIDEI